MVVVLHPLGDVQHIGPVFPLFPEKPHLYTIELTKEAIGLRKKTAVYDFLEVACVRFSVCLFAALLIAVIHMCRVTLQSLYQWAVLHSSQEQTLTMNAPGAML